MDAWFAAVGLTGGPLPVVVDVAAIALVVAAAVGWVARGGHRIRRALLAAAALGAGAVVGLGLCWLLSDRLDLFEVSLSPTSRAWIAGAFAAAVLGILVLIAGRGRWRVVAAGAVVAGLLAGALGVNADFGQYTTIGSLAGASVAAPLPASVLAAQRTGAPGAIASGPGPTALWRHGAAPGMPHRGLVGRVRIPATVSHFPAREAYVYLPPAALVAHPVALPVLMMLSGQPGGPSNVISSGRLPSFLDAFADAHRGLTPIVVIPDQLGAPQRNPMCVDGALGASATYLTVDVPHWIRTHLTVQTGRGAWAIGGFSQGGTCSIQLGADHPGLFATIFDISGQLAPKNGSLANTIALGFHGDAAAYRAALPVALLARHAPYRSTLAVFGVGQLDAKYGPATATVAAAASAAGMSVTRIVSPGTAHDWHTVQDVFRRGLPVVLRHLGLERPA